jgi:hypothetical protein
MATALSESSQLSKLVRCPTHTSISINLGRHTQHIRCGWRENLCERCAYVRKELSGTERVERVLATERWNLLYGCVQRRQGQLA